MLHMKSCELLRCWLPLNQTYKWVWSTEQHFDSACCGFVEIDGVSLQVQDYPTQPPEAECSLGVFVMFRIVWVQLLTIFHNEMIFLLQI